MSGQRVGVGLRVSDAAHAMSLENDMLRDLIADIVTKSVVTLREAGELPDIPLPPVEIDRPQVAAHGDYASNIAMKLAAALRASGEKSNPRALGEQIAQHVRETVAVVPAY